MYCLSLYIYLSSAGATVHIANYLSFIDQMQFDLNKKVCKIYNARAWLEISCICSLMSEIKQKG